MIFHKIFKFILSIGSGLRNNKAVYFKNFKVNIVNIGSGLNFTNVVLTFIIKSVRKKVLSLSDRVKRIYHSLMNIIKNPITYISFSNRIYPKLLLLASFIFFACIVALRLRERLPRAIFPVNNLQWYIYLGILLINLIVFYLLVRNLSGSKPSAYFAKLAGKIEAIKNNVETQINNEYMSLLYSNHKVAYYLQYLLYLNYKFFSELDSRTQVGYYYVFLVIPKIIVCLMFSYDVLIGNNLLYFYKVVWLLLLPLFFRMFVYSLNVLYNTEFPAIEQLYGIPEIEENNWKGFEQFKILIIMDQTKDETSLILVHVYNHVKNVLKSVINYPPQDMYIAFRQYLIYKRIWFTLGEIESFKEAQKKLEISLRMIYIVNLTHMLNINHTIHIITNHGIIIQ